MAVSGCMGLSRPPRCASGGKRQWGWLVSEAQKLCTTCCGEVLYFREVGDMVTCDGCGKHYLYTGVPEREPELTVADLRAYCERGASECGRAVDACLDQLEDPTLPMMEAQRIGNIYRALDSRANLYRELVRIIDRGELPD